MDIAVGTTRAICHRNICQSLTFLVNYFCHEGDWSFDTANIGVVYTKAELDQDNAENKVVPKEPETPGFEIPLEYILLETDCPYLTPHPHRGERNDSSYLPLVAEKIAEIKNIKVEDVILKTGENAKRCFNIK